MTAVGKVEMLPNGPGHAHLSRTSHQRTPEPTLPMWALRPDSCWAKLWLLPTLVGACLAGSPPPFNRFTLVGSAPPHFIPAAVHEGQDLLNIEPRPGPDPNLLFCSEARYPTCRILDSVDSVSHRTVWRRNSSPLSDPLPSFTLPALRA